MCVYFRADLSSAASFAGSLSNDVTCSNLGAMWNTGVDIACKDFLYPLINLYILQIVAHAVFFLMFVVMLPLWNNHGGIMKSDETSVPLLHPYDPSVK